LIFTIAIFNEYEVIVLHICLHT